MTHTVAGYPSMEKCEELVQVMDKAGVGFIEIQIPFSDPVADGPTIMEANKVALDRGVKVEDCFMLMERLHEKVTTPLLFMSYFNILLQYGVNEFCKRAAEAGCYGLIVPDMPIDEEDAEGYLAACENYGLVAIQIVSPLTPNERLQKIGEVASGFVYCVAKYGVTGSVGGEIELSDYLKRVKKYVDVPLAVGFGISERKQIEKVWQNAEIAVVGSAIIRLMNSEGLEAVQRFLISITQPVSNK